MAETPQSSAICFADNKLFVAELLPVSSNKFVSSIGQIIGKTNENLAETLLLQGEGVVLDLISDECKKIFPGTSSTPLKVSIPPSLFLTTIVPLSEGEFTPDELTVIAQKEIDILTHDQKGTYIHEWVQIANNQLLIFWIPEVVVARIQLFASKISRTLQLIDFEPLTIITAIQDKINVNPKHFSIIIGMESQSFYLMAFNQSDLIAYKFYNNFEPVDAPIFILKFLKEFGLEKNMIDQIFWYGMEQSTLNDNLKSILKKSGSNLLDELKLLYHKNANTGITTPEHVLPAIILTYRNDT